MEQQSREAFNPIQMVEDHAAKLGISVYKLLLKAEKDPSSMSRWRKGTMPNTKTLIEILSVKPVR